LSILVLVLGCDTAAPPVPVLSGVDWSMAPDVAETKARPDDSVTPPPIDLKEGPCTSDEDCAPYFCSLETSVCVECLINAHCQPAFECEEHECLKKENGCTSDGECVVKGLVCDEDAGECVECVDSPQCPAGQYCLQGKCLDWACTPKSKWCEGSVAVVCNEDGSALGTETQCDDFDVCTEGDGCLNGECKQLADKVCDDANPCTDDACDPWDGCYSQFNDDPCDDGTDCTEDDHCDKGLCVGGKLKCECAVKADCAPFEDGNLCNGLLHCQGGYCKVDPETVVVCTPPADPCSLNSCVPAFGQCLPAIVKDGSKCDDGSDCTTDDQCSGGKCTGVGLQCNDSNPCTKDSCDPEQGCLFVPQAANCDDGDKCTGPDSCLDGICFGPALSCEDGNPCTTNTCDSAAGCLSAPLIGPCEDGDACTTNDTCFDSVCKGEKLVCQDDGNFCTWDLCDPLAGCIHKPNDLPCDDKNACTVGDKCQSGECVPGPTLFDCDDDNPCTNDSCEIDSGTCFHTPNAQPCDDKDPCTEGDTCANSICVPGPLKSCDDQNLCTEDSCTAQGQCMNTPISAPCEDGNACTSGDKCVGGQCQPGQPVKCNDSNVCTDDGCVPATGCAYAPNANACSDSDACTLGDQCVAGECQAASTLECGDSNPCTDDSCHPETGCTNVPNALPCDDLDACTTGEFCAAAVCAGGKPVNCDDQELCTTDTCDPKTGCVSTPNALLCEDGNACTFNDVCAGGKCQPGPLNDCKDGNDCTEDVCQNNGCLHPFKDGNCDDKDPCTVGDKCGNGACMGTAVANCGCYSLALDGSTAYGRVPNNSKLNLTVPFTIELWFNAATVAGSGLFGRWGHPAAPSERAFLLQTKEGKKVEFRLMIVGKDEPLSIVADFSTLDVWHHVAAVASGTALNLYVDGTLAGTAVLPGGATVPATNGSAYLGVLYDSGVAGGLKGYLNGKLDEIRLSNKALYSGPSFQPSPWLGLQEGTVGYWGADNGQLAFLFDTSANSLHGVLAGKYSWSADTAAKVCTPKANYPPGAPVLSIQPPNPADSNDLFCKIETGSTDIEFDAVTYQYAWYKSNALQPALTQATVSASLTTACPPWQCDKCERWECVVTPSDGKPGVAGWASAYIGKSTCKTCDGTVYGNNCYLKNTWATDWNSAKNTCIQWGGHLATIFDASENAFVNGLCGGACWIGLTDAAVESVWVWVTGEPLGAYHPWAPGEPNNQGGNSGGEDCVTMWTAGTWNDGACLTTALPFICEKEP
jgi:hypothetical protein